MNEWDFFSLQLTFITVRNEVAKVMFLHLSVSHSVHRGGTLVGAPLGPGAPTRTRYTRQDQVHPLGPGTLPRQVPPGSDTPPGPGTSPPDQVHPPGPGTPPRTRYTPWDQAPSPGRYPRDQIHPQDRYIPQTRYTPRPSRRLLLRTVRILLECILVLSHVNRKL